MLELRIWAILNFASPCAKAFGRIWSREVILGKNDLYKAYTASSSCYKGSLVSLEQSLHHGDLPPMRSITAQQNM